MTSDEDPGLSLALVFQCVVLSVASSLDNFTVGTSLGAYQQPLSMRVNIIVSVSNALGSICSAGVGGLLGEAAPSIAAIFGASIFVWLGIGEVDSYFRDEPSELARLAAAGVAWKLALPMTLNNLAGGVAGGLAGVGAVTMGLGGLCASFFLMLFGHALGKYGAATLGEGTLNPSVAAALAFLGLGTNQFADLFGWVYSCGITISSLVVWYAWCFLPGPDTPTADEINWEEWALDLDSDEPELVRKTKGVEISTQTPSEMSTQTSPPPSPRFPGPKGERSDFAPPRQPMRPFISPHTMFSPAPPSRYPSSDSLRSGQVTRDFSGAYARFRARRLYRYNPRQNPLANWSVGSLLPCCANRINEEMTERPDGPQGSCQTARETDLQEVAPGKPIKPIKGQ